MFVLTAALVTILLLMAARHHPPSRRKIKEIWHGHVFWESNTTMLRLSFTPDDVHTSVDSAVDSAIDTSASVVLAVIVLTARDFKDRREVIRETWGRRFYWRDFCNACIYFYN